MTSIRPATAVQLLAELRQLVARWDGADTDEQAREVADEVTSILRRARGRLAYAARRAEPEPEPAASAGGEPTTTASTAAAATPAPPATSAPAPAAGRLPDQPVPGPRPTRPRRAGWLRPLLVVLLLLAALAALLALPASPPEPAPPDPVPKSWQVEAVVAYPKHPGTIDATSAAVEVVTDGPVRLWRIGAEEDPARVFVLRRIPAHAAVATDVLTSVTAFDGQWHHLRLDVVQNGPDLDVSFLVDGTVAATTTVRDMALGRVITAVAPPTREDATPGTAPTARTITVTSQGHPWLVNRQ